MRGGIWVLEVAAAVWATAAILVSRWPPAWIVLPRAASAAMIAGARRLSPASHSAEDERRIGRVVGVWNAVEGVAIFVVADVLIDVGLPDAVMPAIAIIVGLHFLPLARGMPMPIYRPTAVALVAVGMVALALPADLRPTVIGLGAAAVLWAVAALIVRRARR